MKVCKECGGEKFTAKQQCYHDVIIDGNGMFLKDDGVSDSEAPYGTFGCINCGAEYEWLSELPDKQNFVPTKKKKKKEG